VLRTRSPLDLPQQAAWTSFDLHVLSTPPAFVLSQDQTLHQEPVRPDAEAAGRNDGLKRTPDTNGCMHPATGVGHPVRMFVDRLPRRADDVTGGNRPHELTDSVSATRRPSTAARTGVRLLFRFQGAEARALTGETVVS
jgi:hypothetical protein